MKAEAVIPQPAREDFSGVSITMLNTKSEIESQLEAAAEQWGELTGANWKFTLSVVVHLLRKYLQDTQQRMLRH